MPPPKRLDPSAFSADCHAALAGSRPIGVLLIHGLPGSAAETRPMGEYLAALGMSVRCPLLPGHGTAPADLIHIHRRDWIGEVETALQELCDRCAGVFVGGLSMGSLLAMHLAVNHPGIAGLIAMAPAIKLQNRLAPLALVLRYAFDYVPLETGGDHDLGDPEAIHRIWCYDELATQAAAQFYLLQLAVRRSLHRIRQPLLVFQGRRDAQVHRQAPQLLIDRVSSTDKQAVWLEDSGHNLLADGERQAVWARSYAWMMERSRPGGDGQAAQ